MELISIKDIFILFGTLFACVLIIGKLAERTRERADSLMIALLLYLGLYQLISYFLYCRPAD
ncbi:MAG: hypothetical protein ACRCUT_15000, partial [Spirochaetota bacterium]